MIETLFLDLDRPVFKCQHLCCLFCFVCLFRDRVKISTFLDFSQLSSIIKWNDSHLPVQDPLGILINITSTPRHPLTASWLLLDLVSVYKKSAPMQASVFSQHSGWRTSRTTDVFIKEKEADPGAGLIQSLLCPTYTLLPCSTLLRMEPLAKSWISMFTLCSPK
jgi:hypothetical protein